MTGTGLKSALDAMKEVDSDLVAPVPESWRQGRTAYGGYSAALLLAAARRQVPDLPPLRSALINFTAPLSEPPKLNVKVLRQGRNVTTVQSVALVDGTPAAMGCFSFGKAQNSAISVGHRAPDAPAPADTPPMIPPGAEAFAPRFHSQFDLLRIDGDMPFSGSDRPYLRGWVRHRDPASRAGPEALLCLADALPPAVFPMFPKLGPNSSVSWICNFLSDAPETEDGWWQTESRATAAANGYSSQVMRVWNSRGDLVVEGMQSVLVFV